ncbi:CAP domain-containing protein [Catellatospora sp. NPDC049111]|uniref:CAP domain-containing protein n=1 Tax=Catellatospora sp. NPDC049111 TaxID=3155271 RepID=UPI00340D1D77
MLLRRLLAAGLVACLAGCAGRPTGPAAPGDGADLVTLINQRRAEPSCPAVTADQRLADAAKRHAQDMLDHGVRDHTGSDGSTAAQRIADTGFDASTNGEILYWAQGTGAARQAVDAWMDSPGHRTIISDCELTKVGAAALTAGGEFAAVADFASGT